MKGIWLYTDGEGNAQNAVAWHYNSRTGELVLKKDLIPPDSIREHLTAESTHQLEMLLQGEVFAEGVNIKLVKDAKGILPANVLENVRRLGYTNEDGSITPVVQDGRM